jgi:predicted metal-dependent phosphoesterase TrpH
MLKWFKTELHVHTCLSPCADILMSPRKIVAEVLRQQIRIIAITDHNSADNALAVMRAAANAGIVVLPGMEVCTREEVHVLAIFENASSSLCLQAWVYDHLKGTNDAEVFGLQVVANEMDQVDRFEDKLLIGATDLSIEETVARIHELDGLAIAAHIDREGFGIIGQLGFIPETLRLDALEVSSNTTDEDAATMYGMYEKYTFIRNSDAHFLNQIGKNSTRFLLAEPSFGEIRKALQKQDGRTVQTGFN